MNVVKQKNEVVEDSNLVLAQKLQTTDIKQKTNWLHLLLGFFFRKGPDLGLETWEALEYRRSIPKYEVADYWANSYRWYV